MFQLSLKLSTLPLPRNATCMQSTYNPILLADSTSKALNYPKVKLADLMFDLLSHLGLVDLVDLMIGPTAVVYSARIVRDSGNSPQTTRCHGE